MFHNWEPSIQNPHRGLIIWPVPENVEITVTLFRDTRQSDFEDKDWTFVIQDQDKKGRRKILASATINMKNYVSEIPTQSEVKLTLKPATKKVVAASLTLTLSDEDMQSIASLMSIGRVSDIGNLDEIEEDEVNISATSQDTSAKISELASKFGLLDTDFDDMGESSLFEKCRPKSNDHTSDLSSGKRDSASSGLEDISHHSSRNGTSPLRSQQSLESTAPVSSERAGDSSNPFLNEDYINLTNQFFGMSERNPSEVRDEGGGKTVPNGEGREASPKKEKTRRKKREKTPTEEVVACMEPQSSSTPEKNKEPNGVTRDNTGSADIGSGDRNILEPLTFNKTSSPIKTAGGATPIQDLLSWCKEVTQGYKG
ncbi:hypothetical protein NP493_110g03015 [Ridgeia piscesae]|uniref:C2 NT-type domain-containing protein n=1 Tax=Ridgeia piscesae TaxID=27915 RepID=A0AAD9P6F1_RIDPI|nr:hypothetical protein NP493_110g03015 [Ridgeia piscesae]